MLSFMLTCVATKTVKGMGVNILKFKDLPLSG